MQAGGHRLLREAHEEPWGQTTSRLLTPEGLLVGITFTPWMHEHTHPHDRHERGPRRQPSAAAAARISALWARFFAWYSASASGGVDVAERRMMRERILPAGWPDAELLDQHRGQRGDLHVAEARKGGDAALQIAAVGRIGPDPEASPSYVFATYVASS